MIDIHCHILPGIDDGPQNVNDCLNMANSAVLTGITHLYATPHHLNGCFENKKMVILEQVKEINKQLQRQNIPLVIHPGQEVRIHRDIFSSLEMDEILTLDNRGEFLLVELPSGEVPVYTQEVIYELVLKGITPIIVHPERNRELIGHHNLLFELVQEGALVQLTSGSIIGDFGKKVKSFSEKIIEHNLAHFIAADAHNTGVRGFTLAHAYEAITKAFGSERTFYFTENAELLLLGHRPRVEKPIPIRKRILGIF